MPQKQPNPISCSAILSLCIALMLMQGCSALSVVPFTLKEMKDYMTTQEECFVESFNKVAMASALSLKQLHFRLDRFELIEGVAVIEGTWNETSVFLKVEAITPGLTKVRSRIIKEDVDRQFSTETALFEAIESSLVQGNVSMSDVVSHMAPIRLTPDEHGKIIAYISDGVEVKSINEKGEWKKISLELGQSGYLHKKWLKNS